MVKMLSSHVKRFPKIILFALSWYRILKVKDSEDLLSRLPVHGGSASERSAEDVRTIEMAAATHVLIIAFAYLYMYISELVNN
jgi:hypothetical protein